MKPISRLQVCPMKGFFQIHFEVLPWTHQYGFQQEQEILVSWFFEFLVSWQEMGDKKQEIDFLHFLVNFDQIVGLFDNF